jgi:hypothetical protein
MVQHSDVERSVIRLALLALLIYQAAAFFLSLVR